MSRLRARAVFVYAMIFIGAGMGGGGAGAQEAPAAADATLVKRGSLLFLQCTACHDITASGPDAREANVPTKVGPSLKGVIGRPAGSLDGYKFSESLRKSGLTWDRPTLDRWLEKPAALVPGTIMVYAGVQKEADRNALLAYLEAATR